MSELITRDTFFDHVATLGTQAGRGAGSPLAFMMFLAKAARDNAIAADGENIGVGTDLRTAVDKFNEYAVKENNRVRKQSTGKTRLSELNTIIKAARMPAVDFPVTLEKVTTEWNRKQAAKKPRKQIEACFIDAARRQKELTEYKGQSLSDEAIELLTRKVVKPGKTLQEQIETFHTKMTKAYTADDFPLDGIEEKENFANMLDACAKCFTPTLTAEETAAKLTAATVENAAMMDRLAKLEALLAASAANVVPLRVEDMVAIAA